MRHQATSAQVWLGFLAMLAVGLAAAAQAPTNRPAGVAVAPAPSPASSTAPAAQPFPPGTPLYNVEIIVFRALSALGPPEDWNLETGAPAGGTADNDTPAAVSGAAAPGRIVRALAPSEFQLNDIEAKLKSSGGYAPVAHVGWSQTASPWGNHTGIPLQRLGIEAPELMGAVSLERGQFLHLGMQLSFTPASAPAGLGAAPGATFLINDTHRVRFYERNYFDHPAFGVIALVTPVQGTRPAGR